MLKEIYLLIFSDHMQFFCNELCHGNKKTFFRGIALAEEINSPVVYQECASILEEIKVII